MTKKGAFTLAEVLITLGIIGVIAAITIPSVIKKYQEVVTVNKVKKFYSMLNEALKRAMVENGELDNWGFKTNDFARNEEIFVTNLKKYISITEDCLHSNSKCILNVNYKNLNGQLWTGYSNSNYKFAFRNLILKNGDYMIIYIYSPCTDSGGSNFSNYCGSIMYDINGEKAPNVVGKDLFVFRVLSNRIATDIIDDCSKNINLTNRVGYSCANWILSKGNMDYLK